ncbi:hypothetical protein [Arundinibacter roseus]|nr:hypothetical protein [Arundinibacter roseus]
MEIKPNTNKKSYKKPVLSTKGAVRNLTLAGGSFSADVPGGATDGPFGG